MPGVSDPVQRHKRNPRRAYDAVGRAVAPATIANSLLNGARAPLAACACGHEAEVPIERSPPESFVPDAGLKLMCGIRAAEDCAGVTASQR